MKAVRVFLCVAILALQLAPSLAWIHGFVASSQALSQISLNTPGGNEQPFINILKAAQITTGVPWQYGNNTNILFPTELDANGYPLFCSSSCWATNSGAKTSFSTTSQAERPGHFTLIWTGGKKMNLFISVSLGSGVLATQSCSGSATGSSSPSCDNTACTTGTGSISGTTLTVSAAPTGTGCTLGPGVPISGNGIAISTFDTPTIITSAGSTCGANTCYTINQSQSVSSGSFCMGGRFEVAVTDDNTTTTASWAANLQSRNNDDSSCGSTHMAFFFSGASVGGGEETAFWNSATPCGSGKACIIGAMFKQRIQQANFAILRDLDWQYGNISSCTTWSSRKPITYASYVASELRNAASGTETYTAGGHVYTIPHPGQYVNSGGTGASGGTISYNAGTDTYSVTLGSGNFVDKQTFIAQSPATGTSSSKISMNGNTAVPILAAYGQALAFGAFTPQNGGLALFVYDADLGGVLSFSGGSSNVTPGNRGMNCGVPPEVFIEINAELGTTPYHVEPILSLDAMTDWTTQYATYQKNAYSPPLPPRFEPTNEPWNSATGPYVCPYLSAKSTVWINADTNHVWTTGIVCGSTGNINSEQGKMVADVGQDLTSVYGAGNFELLPNVQTFFGGASTFNDSLRSAAYIGQSMSPQTGYSQIAAYKYATRVALNHYWDSGYYSGTGGLSSQAGIEVGIAYCYYNYSISTPCQGLYASQAAAMTTKMNSALSNISNATNIFALNATYYPQWNTWASTCGGFGSRPSGCTLNVTSPLEGYEGGLQEYAQGSDVAQTVASATNASQAVLTIANANGCVQGQTVALSSLSGGTWSTAAGNYTVQSATSGANGTCTINLNSTSLGTLSSATLTYTGSGNYVTYIRAAAYLSPDLQTLVGTLYADFVANGGAYPSQYWLGGGIPWHAVYFDDWGYFPLGQCSSCTVSGTTLTLGGTITSVFRNGDTLMGQSVPGGTTMSGCSTSGSGPCGTNSGDTFTLSNTFTVASGEAMSGNATPASLGGGLTSSPITAFKAICTFNNNAAKC